MNQLLAILDTNGLTDIPSARRCVHDKTTSELISLTEGLREAMLQEVGSKHGRGSEGSLDRANFLPSSSLRGASGCADWGCRVGKIRILKRYIALYCDLGIVPINLDWDHSGTAEQQSLLNRQRLAGSLSVLIELRPLFEAGLAVAVPEALRLCQEHWEEAVPGHKRILNAAKKLAKSKAKSFTATYAPIRNGASTLPCLNFTGPEDYLEHGKISHLFGSFPAWVPPRRRSHDWKIPSGTVLRENLILPFFMAMANDALLQSYFGSIYDARYVTNLPGELEFYQALNKRDALAEQTAALCARLTHSIPIMEDVPIEKIVKTRLRDPEAFQNYRSTLSNIVKTYVRAGNVVTDREARDIYTDLLKPQLDALQVKAKNVQREQLKKGIVKVATTAAVMGLGIYSGLLPSELANLVKAVGGFGLAQDLLGTMASIKAEPAEVKNHNLYFLLQLKPKR